MISYDDCYIVTTFFKAVYSLSRTNHVHRQRKQKKLLNSSKSTDTPDATVVPNSAEKASKWQDEDIVYPSDEETSKPRFAVRKPLFKTRNSSAESFISNSSVGLASTVSDVAGTVSKLTGTVPEVVVPLQESPLQQQTVHKQVGTFVK